MSGYNTKWYKKWWAIIIIIFAFLFCALFIVNLFIPAPTTEKSHQELIHRLKEGNKTMTKKQKNLLEDKNNPRIGNKEAEITVVTFLSFDCPKSKAMHSIIREIGINYTKSVKIIFRDFPTSKEAIQLSLAARCAKEQGLFWPIYDKIYQKPKASAINLLAKQINMDMEKFQKCFKNNKHKKEIKKDIQEGKQLGVKGTPTTFINGYKIERKIPRKIFISIIETIINAEKR